MGAKKDNNNKYAGRKIFTGAIVIMAAVFLVTVLNLIMLFKVLRQQVMEIGTSNIENLRSSLQTTMDDASYLARVLATEVEDLIERGASEEEISEWVYTQSDRHSRLTNGACFNVCFTSPGFIVVPGYDVSEDFDIYSRTWYEGVIKKGKGEVYISEPYIDLATDRVCYTAAILLKDGKSTVSLDFTMDMTQEIISKHSGDTSECIIVNSSGQLVGCIDESILGDDMSVHYPEYNEVFSKLGKTTETIGYFNRGEKTAFYCISNNEWYLIYSINRNVLFRDTYVSMFRNVLISLILLVGIFILMIRNVVARRRVEAALDDREIFFTNISGELKQPVSRILVESNPENLDNSVDIEDNMKSIRESAMKLSGLVDNMLAYSGIKNEVKEEQKDSQNRNHDKAPSDAGIYILALLGLCVVIFVVFAIRSMNIYASTEMQKNSEIASSQLSEWMVGRKNATDMLASTIEANPEMLDDYDAFLDYLAKVCEGEEYASLIYVGNAKKANSVIMSDGWVPSNYVVQAYPWYSDAITSDDGYAISQPFFDTTVRTYCITISETMYDSKGNFIGVLGIDYTLDGITDELERNYEKDGYSFLVTNSGLIINHPSNRYAISPSNRVDVRSLNYNKALTHSGYTNIIDYDGTWRFCIAKEESISGFRIIVLKNAVSLLGPIAITTLVFILLLTACIIFVSMFWRRISRWYTHTNEGLKEAVQRAKKADKAKMQFLAQISHELRTPINAVLGMDELITRESTDENILEYANDIQNAGHNLLELVNGLLDFSKIENGKMSLEEVEYRTAFMFKESLNTVIERARKAGLELSTDIDTSLPTLLYGDDLKIRQVIVNLLTNAIKYTPKGSVKLTAKNVSVSNNIVEIYISVKDTGIGIKEADRENLFKSFSRLDQEKNRSIEGTGLGLYIVNKILQMMDTRLELESVYGEGSDFHFTVRQKVINSLPIGEFDEGGEKKNEVAPAKEERYITAPGAKILVVDDNLVNLKVAKGLFKRNELAVDAVDSGRGCIDILKRKSDYDIIFLDHMMPNMDGVEVMKKLRGEMIIPDELPIIVMTANAISGAREEYIAQGFDDYISKPLDVASLETLLAKWLPMDKITYVSKTNGAGKKQELEEEISAPVSKATVSEATVSEATVSEATVSEATVSEATVSEATVSEATVSEATVSEATEPEIFIYEESEGLDIDGDDEMTSEDEAYFAKNVPQINIETGIAYAAGSKSFYKEIIDELIKTESGEELQRYFDAKDYPNYRIKVHAMKNNLRTIGATILGEDAFALETAVKEQRPEYILENHEKFAMEYEKLMAALKNWL